MFGMNGLVGPVFTKPSGKWITWKTKIGPKSCVICITNNGKIYDINERIEEKPPIHEFCQCIIALLEAIVAGTATNKGTQGADWILKKSSSLPIEYITKKEAIIKGWISAKGNLGDVAPDCMIGGDLYLNRNGHLPSVPGRVWYEADINYINGFRGTERILYSSDGLIFVSYDHYETFYEII